MAFLNFVELDEFAVDPAPVADGTVWYNSTEQRVKTQAGGVAIVIDVSPPVSREIIAGDGLVGGGDMSVDRTIDVVANADGSIVVNPDDIQVGVLASDAQHGIRGGGTQHAEATDDVAGFLSPRDKSYLDLVKPFGRERFSALGEADSSTTSTTFQSKLTLSPVVEGGDYVIGYAMDAEVSVNNRDYEVRLAVDGATLNQQTDRQRSGFTGNFGGVRAVRLAAGAHTIELQYRRAGGSTTVTVRNASLFVVRI
jgi:hypothetical protein